MPCLETHSDSRHSTRLDGTERTRKAYITFHATEAIPPKRKTLSDVDVFKGLESADMNEDLEEQLKELMECGLDAC